MKKWQVTKLAKPEEALEIVEVPKPTVNKGQVLVKVKAAALNFFDILLCTGEYQIRPEIPFTLGQEVSGVVEEVGKDVTNVKVGQHVFATPGLQNGGLAEWIVVDERAVLPLTESVSFTDAAAMYITYQTGYYALYSQARLKTGETLLVHAGAGGVGSAAIQLGKAIGATVIATVGSDEKVEVCKQLGADHVINYTSENFAEVVNEITNKRGADVIYDPVGGDVFDLSTKCIAFEGRILIIGFAGGTIATARTNHALVKNYSIVGVNFEYFKRLNFEKAVNNHLEIIKMYEQGSVKPLVYGTYKFDEVVKVLDLIGSRKTWGKLVIEI